MSHAPTNFLSHAPAYAATSLAITHPTLIWSQVLEQKQLRKTALGRPAPAQSQSSSAASVLSQATDYSYSKEQPAVEHKSLLRKMKGFFN
ncbi:hypothetical protein O1611_g4247 [Lasiodiplodia mahajangana]|uniref:Uncharacterized protein n=1 Tax=Lasiodiplodia mahajangana TaxID=1108764 RepID=A0ACC2JQ52_9PEZI|nr:hypothetical protein O1611_g4247 [Lasiodiplodia mahajangana]